MSVHKQSILRETSGSHSMHRMCHWGTRRQLLSSTGFELIVILFCLSTAWAAPSGDKPLEVYFVDVEGGQATLFVTPAGQSMLIDTGWPGFAGRDAERIAMAAKKAGIKKIDYVLITHYHADHVGGAPQLAARIPVGTFIDHGDNRETNGNTVRGWQAYQ